MPKLLPCPFCGSTLDAEDSDILHMTGTAWKDTGVGRKYVRYNQPNDGYCYEINCPTTQGGCGASISNDSISEVVQAWNTRK